MPNVVFVAPYLLEATARFVHEAAGLPDVALGVVTHQDVAELPADLRARLAGHWRVDNALDPDQLVAAVAGLAGQLGRVDRLMAVLEQLQEPVATAREALGIPGMDRETARRFRDKAHMKEVMRAAGVPCARHRLAHTPQDVWAFVAEVGLPVVVKPPAGAGARDTFRIDQDEAVAAWLRSDPPSPARPALVEEFLVGEEFSFESIWLHGEMLWYSLSHYLPTPLEVLRNHWMQWVVLLPRDISGPGYDGIREVGPAAIRALGLDTGIAHMEWFRRPDGSVAVSEVAARPPGAQLLSATSWAHDIDMYRAWTELVIHDRFDAPQRNYAVGAVYLRGQHPGGASAGGTIAAVHNVERLQQDLGHLVVEAQLPRPGQARGGSYEGEGHVIVRHPDTEVVEAALARIVRELRVEVA